MAHCVYGPVEPSENIVSLASTILEDLQTNLLHLLHQGNVLATEGPDVDNVFLGYHKIMMVSGRTSVSEYQQLLILEEGKGHRNRHLV